MQADSKAEILSLLAGRGHMLEGVDALVKSAEVRVYRKELEAVEYRDWDTVEHRVRNTMPLRLVKDRVYAGGRLLFDDDRVEHLLKFTKGESVEEHERSKWKAAKGMRRTNAEFLARHPTLFKTDSVGNNDLYSGSKGVLDAYLSDLADRKREWKSSPTARGWGSTRTTLEEYEKALELEGDLTLRDKFL
ncbi:hypothetical protein LTR56_008543 [Elasticomyces elasticus]|nr:hypothetical protein LTR56_008543 [Elasticomyces elasticus]KAK3653326.1 hypothetical protein LTR22_011286 [Elasticomyces elasticus]KAK4918228.1 hypothetical protein LTR49_013927 [Elasticomyces elasticus]KAK5758385.1 hypothetical protein LTS12_011558 [Elasticomyces elasticus]